jgi:hypothetical protein
VFAASLHLLASGTLIGNRQGTRSATRRTAQPPVPTTITSRVVFQCVPLLIHTTFPSAETKNCNNCGAPLLYYIYEQRPIQCQYQDQKIAFQVNGMYNPFWPQVIELSSSAGDLPYWPTTNLSTVGCHLPSFGPADGLPPTMHPDTQHLWDDFSRTRRVKWGSHEKSRPWLKW